MNAPVATPPACRLCQAPLRHTMVDLGMSPLSNAYLTQDALDRMEPFFPLHVRVCEKCLLVQLREYEAPENIFTDYLYLSSYSETWLRHAQVYAAAMQKRFALGPQSLVVELASNDGYLLKNFKQAGIPVLGIEPARNVARIAEAAGVPTHADFFGERLARELVAKGHKADLMAANNVLAHVPDINDFVSGVPLMLKPQGVWTVEFPHLLTLMRDNQFDTIYHEHFSYLSLHSAQQAMTRHGLRIFDVDELPTHGGSLRLYVCHQAASHVQTPAVAAVLRNEEAAGLMDVTRYARFADQVHATKRALLRFLLDARDAGKSVVGYGAPAKGNTLLNYCGVREDLLSYTVDKSPHKQGRFLPGTHIPIHGPEKIMETRPDYVLILPWNIKDEITQQMAGIRSWGGKFVVAVPRLEVLT